MPRGKKIATTLKNLYLKMKDSKANDRLKKYRKSIS
jgi:hypothetical protein